MELALGIEEPLPVLCVYPGVPTIQIEKKLA